MRTRDLTYLTYFIFNGCGTSFLPFDSFFSARLMSDFELRLLQISRSLFTCQSSFLSCLLLLDLEFKLPVTFATLIHRLSFLLQLLFLFVSIIFLQEIIHDGKGTR